MKPMLSQKAPIDYLGLKYPIAAEIKYDGVRCLAVVVGGKAMLYSRNGKALNNFEEVRTQMAKMPEAVYDGEITSPDGFDKLMTRTNADKGTNTDIKIEYKIFDKLTTTEFTDGISRRTYETRCIKGNVGERVIIKNAVDLDVYYKYVLKSGHEGLILKYLDGIYDSGKSSYWLKLKPKDTIDMKVIGFDGGTGSNLNMLGAIQCQGEVGRCPVFTYVGIGFSKEQREDIWNRREQLKDCIVEIEFQEITKPDKYGHRSLRFPSFKCLRLDKNKPVE